MRRTDTLQAPSQVHDPFLLTPTIRSVPAQIIESLVLVSEVETYLSTKTLYLLQTGVSEINTKVPTTSYWTAV